jgi:hypothetical protein
MEVNATARNDGFLPALGVAGAYGFIASLLLMPVH